MLSQVYVLIAAAAVMFSVIGGLSLLAHYYTLNGIKSRTVGDGQHGTARFSTKNEIKNTYKHILFRPKEWRRGLSLPQINQQGLILGSTGKKNEITALVDTDDVHCLMIGASADRRKVEEEITRRHSACVDVPEEDTEAAASGGLLHTQVIEQDMPSRAKAPVRIE